MTINKMKTAPCRLSTGAGPGGGILIPLTITPHCFILMPFNKSNAATGRSLILSSRSCYLHQRDYSNRGYYKSQADSIIGKMSCLIHRSSQAGASSYGTPINCRSHSDKTH